MLSKHTIATAALLLVVGSAGVALGSGGHQTAQCSDTPAPTTTHAPTDTPTSTETRSQMPTESPTPTPTETPREVRQLPTSPTDTPTDTATGTDTPTATSEPPAGTDDDIYYPPPNEDPDEDGLNNSRERELGTNPHEMDTDGDGLIDSTEYLVEDADPTEKDLFVEVDRTHADTWWLTDREREKIKAAFGEAGVEVHIVEGDVIPTPDHAVNASILSDIKEEHKSTSPVYKYLLLAHDIGSGEDSMFSQRRGYAWSVSGMAVVDQSYPWWFIGENEDAQVVTHELGHLAGLSGNDYRGIDSRDVPFEEYPSVMNYNSNGDYYNFSDGDGFDDLDHLRRESFGEPVYPGDVIPRNGSE